MGIKIIRKNKSNKMVKQDLSNPLKENDDLEESDSKRDNVPFRDSQNITPLQGNHQNSQ